MKRERLNKLLSIAELTKESEEQIIETFNKQGTLGKLEIIAMLETKLIEAGKLSEDKDLLTVFNSDVLGL